MLKNTPTTEIFRASKHQQYIYSPKPYDQKHQNHPDNF